MTALLDGWASIVLEFDPPTRQRFTQPSILAHRRD